VANNHKIFRVYLCFYIREERNKRREEKEKKGRKKKEKKYEGKNRVEKKKLNKINTFDCFNYNCCVVSTPQTILKSLKKKKKKKIEWDSKNTTKILNVTKRNSTRIIVQKLQQKVKFLFEHFCDFWKKRSQIGVEFSRHFDHVANIERSINR
jgi:hypothetical protein